MPPTSRSASCPARRAVCLVLADKADIIHDDGTALRSARLSVPAPLVIRLRYVVKVPYHRRTALSRRRRVRPRRPPLPVLRRPRRLDRPRHAAQPRRRARVGERRRGVPAVQPPQARPHARRGRHAPRPPPAAPRELASSGVRSRLRRLHGRHAAATFSHMCSPPRPRGSTWSIESACPPQYWQRCSSRANTARRGQRRAAGGTAPSRRTAAGSTSGLGRRSGGRSGARCRRLR